MDETPYANTEINEMFKYLQEGQVRIESQVRLTNGRVTELERWKYMGMGALGVLTLIILPILSWALYTLVNINSTIHNAIIQTLSAYNVTVK